MSVTDIITITMIILSFAGISTLYAGVKTQSAGITLAGTLVTYFAGSVLVFILLVTLGTIVVRDTLV